MKPGSYDHQVGCPSMHVAQELAKRNVVLEIENVTKRVCLGWVVVEHQQHAGKRQHDEEIKRYTSHAPGERVTDSVAIDFCRMKVKKDIRQNRQRTIPWIRAIVRNPKNRLPKLRFLNVC